jgi:hypothetical protein
MKVYLASYSGDSDYGVSVHASREGAIDMVMGWASDRGTYSKSELEREGIPYHEAAYQLMQTGKLCLERSEIWYVVEEQEVMP